MNTSSFNFYRMASCSTFRFYKFRCNQGTDLSSARYREAAPLCAFP